MLRIADALFSFTVGNFVYTSHNNVLWSGKKAVFPRQALRFCLCLRPLLSPPRGKARAVPCSERATVLYKISPLGGLSALLGRNDKDRLDFQRSFDARGLCPRLLRMT